MGWFLKDHRLGMLQTPHHFFSPDPFERNLGRFRVCIFGYRLYRDTANLIQRAAAQHCAGAAEKGGIPLTMGWFLKDHRLGMLQTPHHFFSPDPFERNLGRCVSAAVQSQRGVCIFGYRLYRDTANLIQRAAAQP
jgi:LPS sulfotransferase NodH